MKRLRRKLILSVAAGTLALTVGELALRMAEPHLMASGSFLGGALDNVHVQPDRTLFWKLRPGRYEGLFIDRRHVRGYVPKAADDEALRVLCVGDSCTYGAGVDDWQSYAMLLEESLRQRTGQRVVVIRVAAPGYTTYQNRVQLQQWLPAFRPHLVTLYLGAWNDYVACVGRTDRERAGTALALGRLLARTAEARHREEVQAAFRSAATRANSASTGLLHPLRRRVPLDDFRENVRWMVDESQRHGAEVFVLIPPLPATTEFRHPVALEYRDALREAAGQANAGVIDAAATFQALETPGAEAPRKSPWFLDWVHPSAAGHRVLARLVLDRWVRTHPFSADDASPLPTRAGYTLDASPFAACEGGSVTVRGSLKGVTRVWIGPALVLPHSLDAGRFAVDVPASLPPGQHALRLECGAAGAVVVSGCTVTVLPARLEAATWRTEDGIRIRLHAHGPPRGRVTVWVSPRPFAEPRSTRFGDFLLHDAVSEGSNSDVPFTPGNVDLNPLVGRFTETGEWRREWRVPDSVHGSTLCFQGLVLRPGRTEVGAFTRAVEIALPR